MGACVEKRVPQLLWPGPSIFALPTQVWNDWPSHLIMVNLIGYSGARKKAEEEE